MNATAIVSIDGMNELIQQIINFNRSNDYLLVFTIGLFFTAVIANVISFYFLRGELNQIKKDARQKTRPILARHIHQKELKNLTEPRNGDTYAISHEKALFHFINNGTTTAINVKRQKYVELTNQSFSNPRLDPRNPNDILRLSDIAPTEYYSIDVEWNSGFYNAAVSGKTCHFGLLVWYDNEDGNHYYYQIEGYFDKTMLMLDYVRTGTLD